MPPISMQRCVPVLEDDTWRLAARVLPVEHQAYVQGDHPSSRRTSCASQGAVLGSAPDPVGMEATGKRDSTAEYGAASPGFQRAHSAAGRPRARAGSSVRAPAVR